MLTFAKARPDPLPADGKFMVRLDELAPRIDGPQAAPTAAAKVVARFMRKACQEGASLS